MRWIHWFRNDLRLVDNTALARAASEAERLIPVFVLDDRLIGRRSPGGPRVRFLAQALERLAADLVARGSRLVIRRGDPRREIPRLAREVRADGVAWNRDYTPYARRRDAAVAQRLEREGRRTLPCKDRVIFEAEEIRTQSGGAYAVYTPYRRAWWARLRETGAGSMTPLRLPPSLARVRSEPLPDPGALDSRAADCDLPPAGEAAARRRLRRFCEGPLRDYPSQRDLPARDGTSRLSPQLRFGTLSVRQCVRAALERAAEDARFDPGARKWIDELVWREFYQAILWEHPRVLRHAHRSVFETLDWEEDPQGLEAWKQGRTGFPLVDAGMRQLRATGWMHNRVRMVVASFLTKDLGIHWLEGERHFMRWLVDGEPASNAGGWQWSASTGTDAQPWFRIFNPVAQGRRYDPEGEYVRRWVPELAGLEVAEIHEPGRRGTRPSDYPPPILDHAERRQQALARFRTAQARAVR